MIIRLVFFLLILLACREVLAAEGKKPLPAPAVGPYIHPTDRPIPSVQPTLPEPTPLPTEVEVKFVPDPNATIKPTPQDTFTPFVAPTPIDTYTPVVRPVLDEQG